MNKYRLAKRKASQTEFNQNYEHIKHMKVSDMAASLGISRKTIHRWINKLSLLP